jgi:hypothetical protein
VAGALLDAIALGKAWFASVVCTQPAGVNLCFAGSPHN